MPRVILRLTGKQHQTLRKHLFPGDELEAAAIVLCGRHHGAERHVITAHRIVPVPYDQCIRDAGRLEWKTNVVVPLIEGIMKHNWALLKVHSHPGGFRQFSELDDAADTKLFSSVAGWCLNGEPHASAVMLPDGELFGRVFTEDGGCVPIERIMVAGDEIQNWPKPNKTQVQEFTGSHLQIFGERTVSLLQGLTIGIIGCSGTGSPLVEMLARLGAGRLVLIDPDIVEVRNLNRIYNATREDAIALRPKVEVLARAINRMSLGTVVVPMQKNAFSKEAVRAMAACDVIFGCVDGHDGRYLLNKIASYYLIPYFDVGVTLHADGNGGIQKIAGSVHYIQPDGSSLISRGTISLESVRAAGMKRVSPEMYSELRKSKYIQSANEARPAVISVNTEFAARAVNEFLARIHPYRSASNTGYAWRTALLTDDIALNEPDGAPCSILAGQAGRGDVEPILEMPELS